MSVLSLLSMAMVVDAIVAGAIVVGAIVVGDSEAVPDPSRGYAMLSAFALVAVGFSFLCSIAEAVLLSVTPSYIVTLKEQSKKSAELLERLKRNIDRPLAAILSLNTIAHTVGAAGVGAEAAAIWGSRSIGIASAVMTLLILVFSEIIPKTIGAMHWRRLAPMIAPVIQFLIWALLPLVWLSDLLTKLIGGGHGHSVTRQEVAAMASLSAEAGHLDVGESRVLQNLFKLDELTAEDIMTPRTVMIALPQNDTVAQAFEKLADIPVSRLPLYDGTLDKITGVVLKIDILLRQANGELDTPLISMRRDLRAVPWNASLKQLLGELLDQREHMALVVDEYGGTDGLVTLEDLIETLLGSEIVDEDDVAEDMQAVARRQWRKRVEALGLDVRSLEQQTPTPPLSKEEKS